jgi:hypothetical protein
MPRSGKWLSAAACGLVLGSGLAGRIASSPGEGATARAGVVVPADRLAPEPIPAVAAPAFGNLVGAAPLRDLQPVEPPLRPVVEPLEEPPTAEQPASEDDDAPAESAPPRTLAPALVALRDRVRKTLQFYQGQPLSARENTATEVIAACLAFGCRTEALRPDAPRERINAVTLLCWNHPAATGPLLMLCDGHVTARVGYGFQERPGQLAAVLALARVPADYPVRVGDDVRTVADLIEYEKLACRSGSDMSFRLIALARYAGDSTWENALGEPWSVERVLGEEIAGPIAGAPHGGTDRLKALAYALHRWRRSKQPIDGQYLRAQDYLAAMHEHALSVQNADGSWGAGYLSTAGESRDPAAQFDATGRIAAWLVLSLPEEQLDEAPMVRAIDLLDRLLAGQRYRTGLRGLSTAEIASAMHALHALSLYDDRMFKPADPSP